jgi:hypothetical protein
MCLLVIISFHNATIRLAWRQSLSSVKPSRHLRPGSLPPPPLSSRSRRSPLTARSRSQRGAAPLPFLLSEPGLDTFSSLLHVHQCQCAHLPALLLSPLSPRVLRRFRSLARPLSFRGPSSRSPPPRRFSLHCSLLPFHLLCALLFLAAPAPAALAFLPPFALRSPVLPPSAFSMASSPHSACSLPPSPPPSSSFPLLPPLRLAYAMAAVSPSVFALRPSA